METAVDFRHQETALQALRAVPALAPEIQRIVMLVVDAVRSDRSKRAYAHAVAEYLQWCATRDLRVLWKPSVQQYRSALERRGLAPSSINVALSAIRKLAAEASDTGYLAPEIAASIARVKGSRISGQRIGTWLTVQEAQRFLALPDEKSNKGKRDRVIVAFLVGCGLRREELVHLSFEDVQERDGRQVIVDLSGKGKRIRSVPIAPWAKPLVEEWAEAVGEACGPIVRRISKRGVISSKPITAQAIYKIIKQYAEQLGRSRIAPHDLRRTFAHLAYRGGAPLEQVQLSLGHASLRTTERYLGVQQNLADAPADRLGLVAPKKASPLPTVRNQQNEDHKFAGSSWQ